PYRCGQFRITSIRPRRAGPATACSTRATPGPRSTFSRCTGGMRCATCCDNSPARGSLPMARLLVTGGAGFIGANFVHYWLAQHPADEIVVLDALTYAGNRHNLDGVASRCALVVG